MPDNAGDRRFLREGRQLQETKEDKRSLQPSIMERFKNEEVECFSGPGNAVTVGHEESFLGHGILLKPAYVDSINAGENELAERPKMENAKKK
jgi:hypothetical protein